MKRRNTAAKQMVLGILRNANTALSQDSIEKKVAGEMDRVTIYRVLNSFCEDGITHRITSDEGKYYFAICKRCTGKHAHNHIHFRCNSCDKVECIGDDLPVVLPKGYVAESFNCWISGYCSSCKA